MSKITTILDFRAKRGPIATTFLGNFMLYNMLGHLWLDGKECPWPNLNYVYDKRGPWSMNHNGEVSDSYGNTINISGSDSSATTSVS